MEVSVQCIEAVKAMLLCGRRHFQVQNNLLVLLHGAIYYVATVRSLLKVLVLLWLLIRVSGINITLIALFSLIGILHEGLH